MHISAVLKSSCFKIIQWYSDVAITTLTLMNKMLDFVRNSKLNCRYLCDFHMSVHCDHVISRKRVESMRTVGEQQLFWKTWLSSQCCQKNSGIVCYNRLRTLHYTSIPVYYSLMRSNLLRWQNSVKYVIHIATGTMTKSSLVKLNWIWID
jgi:hypothetical protein